MHQVWQNSTQRDEALNVRFLIKTTQARQGVCDETLVIPKSLKRNKGKINLKILT